MDTISTLRILLWLVCVGALTACEPGGDTGADASVPMSDGSLGGRDGSVGGRDGSGASGDDASTSATAVSAEDVCRAIARCDASIDVATCIAQSRPLIDRAVAAGCGAEANVANGCTRDLYDAAADAGTCDAVVALSSCSSEYDALATCARAGGLDTDFAWTTAPTRPSGSASPTWATSTDARQAQRAATHVQGAAKECRQSRTRARAYRSEHDAPRARVRPAAVRAPLPVRAR